jgi:hypothetical protein
MSMTVEYMIGYMMSIQMNIKIFKNIIESCKIKKGQIYTIMIPIIVRKYNI